MNYGKFFRLNSEKSNLSLGITCYDYIWLSDKDKDNELLKFPIYVTISKDSIDFHTHYYDDYKDSNDKHIYKHSHNTILSLPLSANIEAKDGLTEALVEGYETNFPRYEKIEANEKLSSYLWKLHWKAFWKNRKWKKTYTSYFELDAFAAPKEKPWKRLIKGVNNFDSEKTYINKRKAEKSEINRFIRKLVLDFMFDLEHTKVFQTSPHYEHISVKLKENYFFSSLAAKANFYYWRDIIIQEKKNRTGNKASQLSAYIEYYLKAEREWTKCIRSPKAQTNFNDYKDRWFKDPEEEMNDVYGGDFNSVNSLVKKYNKEHEKQKEETEKCRDKSSRWLTWNYAWKLCQINPFSNFFGIHLFFPKLIVSVLTAWVTIIIGSDLLPAMLSLEDIGTNAKTIIENREIKNNVNIFNGDSLNYYFFNNDISILTPNALSDTIEQKENEAALFKIAHIENGWLWLFVAVVTFVIFFIVFYSVRYKRKNRSRHWSWFLFIRPIKVWLISLFFSMLFGAFLSMMFGASVPIISTDNFIPSLCDYFSNIFYNSFYWSCVFLAMFIGVILQRVTEEKYTEE